MSWWAEIDVILGALCKQRGKRQTVTSGSHIIPTTWSMFAWACGGFGPGMHVWFHCMSTSFAPRKGPNESCTFIRVHFSNVLCLVECLSCWFLQKNGPFRKRRSQTHLDVTGQTFPDITSSALPSRFLQWCWLQTAQEATLDTWLDVQHLTVLSWGDSGAINVQ